MCQECPQRLLLFGSTFFKEWHQLSIISTAVAVVSVLTELHKIQKDHSCHVKAIIQSFLQVEQKRTFFLCTSSSVVASKTIGISEDFASCSTAQLLEVMQWEPHSKMVNTEKEIPQDLF